jgi:hypothetical protein
LIAVRLKFYKCLFVLISNNVDAIFKPMYTSHLFLDLTPPFLYSSWYKWTEASCLYNQVASAGSPAWCSSRRSPLPFTPLAAQTLKFKFKF